MGHVSPLGADLQQGLETSSGLSGQVWMKRATLPPPVKKVERATLPEGAIKMRSDCAPEAMRVRSNRKWVNVEKGDLETLARVSNDEALYRYRVVGPVVSGAPVLVTAKNDLGACSALICRMFATPLVPLPGIWEFAKNFRSLLWPGYECPPKSMSTRDWLASMPAHRMRALTQAFELYSRTGWRKRYSEFSSFLKDEFLPGFAKEELALRQVAEVVPRLINAPHDVTHLIAGPKIKPFMGWLKEQWGYDNYIFYGSATPDKLQKWLDRFSTMGQRFYFWSDYSMFDASHNADTWDFVEHFYREHQHDQDFVRVLEAWRAPKGKLGNFKYTGRIMNASGRDDTAYANAVLNGTAMVLSVTAAWCGKTLTTVTRSDVEEITSVLVLSVCGDDALGSLPYIGSERADRFLKDCKDNLAKFGFTAKMFGSYRLVDAVYLGHRPYCVAGRWFWGKTLGRALYKLGYQRSLVGDGCAFFNGIVQMHLTCSRHVPILGDIARIWWARTEGQKVTSWVPDPNKPWENMGLFGPDHYDQSTLDALAQAYTVDSTVFRTDLKETLTDVEVKAEDFIELLQELERVLIGLPCVVDHWLLRHMVLVDEQ